MKSISRDFRILAVLSLGSSLQYVPSEVFVRLRRHSDGVANGFGQFETGDSCRTNLRHVHFHVRKNPLSHGEKVFSRYEFQRLLFRFVRNLDSARDLGGKVDQVDVPYLLVKEPHLVSTHSQVDFYRHESSVVENFRFEIEASVTDVEFPQNFHRLPFDVSHEEGVHGRGEGLSFL